MKSGEMEKKLLSVIGPMYNEESLVSEYISQTINSLECIKEKYEYELVLVNDGSSDNTYEKLIEAHANNPYVISVVNHSRNFGLEGAVKSGLEKAKGDYVVVMDADLQDPPSLISAMLEKAEAGADIVIATRKARNNDNLFKRSTADLYYKILDTLSGKLKLERNAANFRLLSRKAVNQIKELPEVNPTFRVSVPFIGMKTDVVYYERDKRYAGKTKYNLSSLIKCALDGITGISVKPLENLFKIAIFLFLLFIVAFASVFFVPLSLKPTSVIISIMLFLAVIFSFILSVIATYIAQIMIEVKRRPTSIIYEYIQSEVSKKYGI